MGEALGEKRNPEISLMEMVMCRKRTFLTDSCTQNCKVKSKVLIRMVELH